MEIKPHAMSWKSIYKLLTGAIIPRPIGWISTVDQGGNANLAPFSFFNAVCANPPTVLFSPMIRGTDLGSKDTLNNVRATGEFVVNIVTADLIEAVVKTSAELPPEVNEFEFAALHTTPSAAVRPPRVTESPIHFECRVSQIITISESPGGGSLVLGEVVHIHVSPEVQLGEDKIDPVKLQAVGRMGGPTYCHTIDLFDLQRPPSQIASPKF